jgi:hypothetical protein
MGGLDIPASDYNALGNVVVVVVEHMEAAAVVYKSPGFEFVFVNLPRGALRGKQYAPMLFVAL